MPVPQGRIRAVRLVTGHGDLHAILQKLVQIARLRFERFRTVANYLRRPPARKRDLSVSMYTGDPRRPTRRTRTLDPETSTFAGGSSRPTVIAIPSTGTSRRLEVSPGKCPRTTGTVTVYARIETRSSAHSDDVTQDHRRSHRGSCPRHTATSTRPDGPVEGIECFRPRPSTTLERERETLDGHRCNTRSTRRNLRSTRTTFE